MNVSLVMQSTNGSERTFPVRKSPIVIGSEAGVDIRVPIPSVSQRHCELCITDRWITLTDLNSESGTLLNGDRVESALLKNCDQLTIGSVTFEVRMETESKSKAKDLPDIHVEPRGIGQLIDKRNIANP